jgi:chromosome segregation ATPase
MISKLHSKVKDLSQKLEDVEKQKRAKVKEVRKTLELELNTLKERN